MDDVLEALNQWKLDLPAVSPGGCSVALCSSARRLETATVTRNAVAVLRGSVARGQKYVSAKVV